ncbi:hypothetical protein [Sorangium cellulosum]|nr:hypothetical protein [Sorangium cellulosum]
MEMAVGLTRQLGIAVDAPTGIAVDETRVYWANEGSGTILKPPG